MILLCLTCSARLLVLCAMRWNSVLSILMKFFLLSMNEYSQIICIFALKSN